MVFLLAKKNTRNIHETYTFFGIFQISNGQKFHTHLRMDWILEALQKLFHDCRTSAYKKMQ